MSSIASRVAVTMTMAILSGTLTVASAFASSKPQAFTGKVSDAMCGANHMMAGEASDCTRVCVRKGSKYALVVGEKVYSLDTSDKATLDQLDKLADRQAKVTGDANGDSIAVLSVAAAK